MRFELLDRRVEQPLKYPNGDFILYSPIYINLSASEIRKIAMGIAVVCDNGEGFFIRTFPELFEKKQISVATFQRRDLELELILHNTNAIRSQNVVQSIVRASGSYSINPREPIAILTPVMLEKS